jgi:prepilin-type N-terminal cleavage/methylation domain-containing protein
MKWRMFKSQQGFTLIEVMVAALVIVLGMTALAGVFTGAQSEASADVQQNQLINIADSQIEQLSASASSHGFDAVGVMLPGGEGISSFSPLSSATIRNTWLDPEKFVEGGCFEIANNYDDVTAGSSASAPYGTAPAGFTPWSNCSNTHSEPLQTFSGGGGLVQWSGSPVAACNMGASTVVTVPCYQNLSSACPASGSYSITSVPACAVTVYAFITDTYVGCEASATNTPAAICPTVTDGTVQAVTTGTSSCLTTSAVASNSCADARRITVAVVPNVSHTDARVTPVYLSTVLTNPAPSTSQAGSVGLTLGGTL